MKCDHSNESCSDFFIKTIKHGGGGGGEGGGGGDFSFHNPPFVTTGIVICFDLISTGIYHISYKLISSDQCLRLFIFR